MATFPDNKVPVSGNPGLDGGTRIGGPVAPSDWSDMQYGFYTHRANTGKGGWHSGFDIAERDALTLELREFGMVYYCTSGANAGKSYVLSNSAMGGVDNDKSNNANWTEFGNTDPNNLGYYATEIALNTAHPTGLVGNYALVGSTDTFRVWDGLTSAWVNSGASTVSKVYDAITDPAINTALTTAKVDTYAGVIITTTTAGNTQTFQLPTGNPIGLTYIVVNNNTSTNSFDVVDGTKTITIQPGTAQKYLFEGSVWVAVEAVDASEIGSLPFTDITATDIQASLQQINAKTCRIFTTVALSEVAKGDATKLIYCIETETLYRYELSGASYTDNNTSILSTGDGGNTRWLGVSGKYIYNGKHATEDFVIAMATAL